MNGEIAAHELDDSDSHICNIAAKLQVKRMELRSYPTANLWLQYMEMMDLLRRFLKAENWGLESTSGFPSGNASILGCSWS